MEIMEIAKDEVAGLLDALVKEYEVFAPVKKDDLIVFQGIGSGVEAQLDYSNSKKPPKEILFPQSEVLFTYSPDGEVKESGSSDRQRIIFGIRPCDARSFIILDEVFNNETYKDVYYVARREKTLVITLGCNQPNSTCFCTSVGGSPFSREGSDLLLIDIGQKYLAEAVTQKGEELVRKYSQFKQVDEPNLSLMDKVIREAESQVEAKLDTDKIKTKLDGMFEDPFWDLLHEKCLGCGVCTYLCPTCHCFDITDEGSDCGGQRIRTWDSCAFPVFTQEASGVNPRPTNKERYRQRIMHKFKYFMDSYNKVACVGCGRCVRECPVDMDIRVVLANISNRQDLG